MTTLDRSTGIGGSDVPVILGMSPYRSPVELWAEKRGEAEPQASSLPMRIGSLVEGAIATIYAEQNGVTVRRVAPFKPRRVAWIGGRGLLPITYPAMAHIDRRVIGEPGRIGLEVKHTGSYDRFGSEVPDDVALQVQHYLMVTRWDAFDVAVLVGGRDLKQYRIVPDEDAQMAIIEACAEFWRCVESGDQPPIDGSEGATAWLRSRFPSDAGTELVATHSMMPLVDALLAAQAAKKESERAFDLAANRVREQMGDAAVLLAPNAKITWRNQERSTTNWKDAIAALQEAFAIDPAIVDQAIFDATEKKSIRVFTVNARESDL